MDQIVIEDVNKAAAWLVDRGCKAAPVNAPSHAGVVYTQPGGDVAYFAQAGETLVWHGTGVSAQK